MEVRNRVEQASMAAVQKTLAHIQSHLDEPLAPCDLANVACFSQHHFHRLFRAVVGESITATFRKGRLSPQKQPSPRRDDRARRNLRQPRGIYENFPSLLRHCPNYLSVFPLFEVSPARAVWYSLLAERLHTAYQSRSTGAARR